MSAISSSGASTKRSATKSSAKEKASIRKLMPALVLSLLAVSAPAFFIYSKLVEGSTGGSAVDTLVSVVIALAIVAMFVGPLLWLSGKQKAKETPTTRLILGVFVLVGLLATVIATIGAVSVYKFGQSAQILQDDRSSGLIYFYIVIVAIELFVIFLLYQVLSRMKNQK